MRSTAPIINDTLSTITTIIAAAIPVAIITSTRTVIAVAACTANAVAYQPLSSFHQYFYYTTATAPQLGRLIFLGEWAVRVLAFESKATLLTLLLSLLRLLMKIYCSSGVTVLVLQAISAR